MALSSKFKAEPIYKDYNDMKSAFGQVVSSLSQGTPIGDVAGATKMMKLLDPGSVVRETELGIAMAASGRMDRLENYFKNLKSFHPPPKYIKKIIIKFYILGTY